MAFIPLYGTGFEHGSYDIFSDPDVQGQNSGVDGAYAHTGDYGLRVWQFGYGAENGWAQWAVPGELTELYIAAWCCPQGTAANPTQYWAFGVTLDTGEEVEIRRSDGLVWSAYVDGVLASSGSVVGEPNDWQHLQVHFNIDDSGLIQTKIDGTMDVDYSGDTKPGSATHIEYVKMRHYYSLSAWWDDFTYGTGDWPGDIRISAALVPEADTAQADWSPSSGSLNYAMIDEVPPSDADYVSAGSDGYRDMYDLGDWTPSQTGDVQFLMQWVRARAATAEGQALDVIVDSNGSESSSGSLSLTTNFAYYSRILTTNPDGGGAWNQAAINALEAGQEVVI